MKAVNCTCVTPDTDREEAASVAIRAGASALAVCDDDGRFIGAVPAAALMSILRDEHLGRPASHGRHSRQVRGGANGG